MSNRPRDIYYQSRHNAKNINRDREDIEQLKRITSDDTNTTPKTVINQKATTIIPGGAGLSQLDVITLIKAAFADINIAHFNTDPINVSPVEGDLWWNAIDDTLNLMGPDGQNTQIGQEITVPVFNDSGAQIDDGDVVYLSGGNGRPFIELADADTIVKSEALGIVTHDIAAGANGKVTVLGLIRGLDTSGTTVNDPVYLSSTLGEWTTTRPTFPAWIVKLGKIEVVSASEGEILMLPIIMENIALMFGSINENFDFIVDEDTGTVTGSLEKTGGGNVHVIWPSGIEILVTAPLTIDLTANVGTDTVPKDIYVFLDGTTKTIAQNITGWPTTSFVPIAYLSLWSAARTGVDGPRVNQNWNNYSASVTTLMGRIQLLSERVRRLGGGYFSGILGNAGGGSYFSLGTTTGFFLSTEGKAYQMHLHTVPAITMSAVPGDPAFVINNAVTPDTRITNLYSITTLADGTTNLSNNKYFNLVFAVVINKSGTHLLVTLPTDQYTNKEAAKRDDLKTAVFDLGRSLTIDSSTGIFVGRATFQFKTLGTAWVLEQFEPLLGKDPTIAGGAGASYTDADAIAAARTDLLDEDDLVSDSAVQAATQQSLKAYIDTLDALNTHLAGTETITGTKTFEDFTISNAGGAGNFPRIISTSGFAGLSIQVPSGLNSFIEGVENSVKRWGIDWQESSNTLNIQTGGSNSRITILDTGEVLINRSSSSADIFEVTGDAGKTVGGVEWNTICDIDVKDLIGDFNLGLDFIMEVKPKIFRYKEIYGLTPSTRDEVGIISQDLELIAPQMIENRIEKYKSPDWKEKDPLLEKELKWLVGGSDMRYAMVNAIQELKLENDDLKNRVALLEAKSI